MMGSHRPTIDRHQLADAKDLYYATCTCKSASELRLTKQEAEEWVLAHERDVERALANLRRGKGTLTTDMDHAAKMLADPNVSDHDKASWRIIHDAARHRLGLPDVDAPAPSPPAQLW